MRQASELLTDIVKDIIEYGLAEDEIEELFYRTPLMYNPYNFDPIRYFIIDIIGLKYYLPCSSENIKWKEFKHG